MKLFFRYVWSRRAEVLLFLACGAVLTVSFSLYRLPLEAVLYPLALCCAFGLLWLILGFIRVKRKHDALARLRDLAAERIGALPDASSPTEEDYLAIVAGLQQQMADLHADMDARYRDTVDYFTVWAHQIKTPIASMKLALQNEDSDVARQLTSDLFRTQQYVDMVMAYLRLGSDATDYVIRTCDLDTVVRQAVHKFVPEFIRRKLTLDFEPIALTTVTDEKWFAFVVEQLLSNALKYTRTGSIRIYTEGNTLCIADTGMGIAPEDLPRVCEKGYTGVNGRKDKAASGLGLYLCRRVCDNLGIGLNIESAVGQGTTVSLHLSKS